ncbi:MAG: LemA family protein [Clostridiales bacterium]|nr:LemA family protein [Clostridiales bacterium]
MTNLLLLETGALVGIIVGCVAAVLLILLIVYISLYNKLQRLKNLTEEGWATIDVQLKKRYDLIPNLVETVKGYVKHESETLEKVISARNAAMTATGEAKLAAENTLTGTLKSLFALQEAYPQLKANANFIDLQNQLSGIETELASARRYYNATVKELNTKIDVFPSNLVARRMRLEKRTYFELDSAAERVAPSVKF